MNTSHDLSDHRAVLAALVEGVPPMRPERRWQWLPHGPDALDLIIKDAPAPGARGIDNRLAALSCGAELHRVIAELAAEGWTTAVTRRPHRARPFRLATMHIAPGTPAGGPAPHGLPGSVTAHPGRRSDPDRPVASDVLQVLSSAVEGADTKLFVLSDVQVYDLVAATKSADGDGDLGVTPHRPSSADDPTVPTMDTAFAILYGPDDRLRTWLRAGEGFAAGCLATAGLGVSILPLTDTMENAGTRENVRQLLPGPGHPCLIIQVGPRTTVRPA
ncbi:hypothetical protein ACPCHT_21210 [Nucisporomicrobium flavum]|uniref:hypothetical protein n=1 Tax=Nucisporomicrobium flavum TaxID=2785915 RepID=UPI003C2CE8BF